ncbi:MAG: MBL fold metallo-hydrolase [Endomicrobiales bacterium]|nr:MBL fold metallo-hydrolase [Endomicrobiales bacterium]
MGNKMCVNICVLGSSSSGNCTALWSQKLGILIDCGGSIKRWEGHLKSIELNYGKIRGILITHGHCDHINENTINFAQKNSIPIYIHEHTYNTIKNRYNLKDNLIRDGLIKIHTNREFRIDYLKITPFKIYHDDIGHEDYVGSPCGFSVYFENKKISYITDTKEITYDMIQEVLDSDAIVLETNHDLEIIERNPPNHFGWCEHLSNQKAGTALVEMIIRSTKSNSFKYVFLAHVSDDNNTPERPKIVVEKILHKNGINHVILIETYKCNRTSIYTI